MGLRIAFAGTPAFALAPLQALLEAGHEVVLVVTQPDRPAGRGLGLRPPPVKELAQAHRLPLWQPEAPEPAQWAETLRQARAEGLVVAAFAQRIPVSELAFLPLGCLNVHPSLLPRWRGAAPVAWAILAGDRLTGVTIMQMDEGWDTGPILLQRTEPIRPDDTAESLTLRLSRLGGRLLVETLARLAAGTLYPVPQDSQAATRAPRLRKEHGLIRWEAGADAIERQVRAMHPWPGASMRVRGRMVKVLAAAAEPHGPAPSAAPPGTVVGVDGRREALTVACGKGLVHLLRVQPEGGRPMSGRDLANGLRLRPGDRLEEDGA